jgi:hypothetical protein
MNTRFQSQHIIRGAREKIATVTIHSSGATGPPPVRVFAQEGNGAYVDGYLSIEGAELLRRALNDVLGPLAEERETESKDERLRAMLRALVKGEN